MMQFQVLNERLGRRRWPPRNRQAPGPQARQNGSNAVDAAPLADAPAGGSNVVVAAPLTAAPLTAAPLAADPADRSSRLVAADAIGAGLQGYCVALSADGNTAFMGAPHDNADIGAARVYARIGGVWAQQGSKLVGAGAVGAPVHFACIEW
jgi:hypothetical protein